MSYYKPRALPHWNPGDTALFITWRLHGSYPAPPSEWIALPSNERFQREDQLLDLTPTGPHHLKDPRIAQAVLNTLHYAAQTLNLYDLHAWVIMSNHVHILLTPKAPLPRITRSIKNYSAREANRILNQTGPFWQNESYDHWIRNEREFASTLSYIERNPVTAGLVNNPEDWPWSSARAGQEAYPT
jgi:REP element-mobilizing transposase RayT